MRRREFVLLLGAATLVAPADTHAQASRKPVVGWLVAGRSGGSPITDAVVAELSRLGWIDGQTVTYTWRIAESDPARIPALAAELVARKVDLIIAPSPPAAQAAQRATATIPIIALADDMQGSGFVRSLAHPGGNMTGVSILASELDAKRLALLVEMVPTARRVAALADSKDGPSLPQLSTVARELSLDLRIYEARSADEIGPALDAIAAASVDAVNVLASVILHNARDIVMARIAAARLPAIYQWPEYTADGALMAYGPRQTLISRQMAKLVDRVLRGAPVAELPVEQPAAFELVINARTGKALGLVAPPALLARADEVIE